MKIYLADLTHTGSVMISSNIFPLAIGLVGAYLKKHLQDDVDIELFKDPAELDRRLQAAPPDIVGFSNYSWNEQLSLAFAARIKAISPKTVVVFGGPNYGLENDEIAAYWANRPPVDFYVVKEGEAAMLRLVNALRQNDFDVDRTKHCGSTLANCHYLLDDAIVQNEILPRIPVGDLPSPYLMGMMDKFFDIGFIPMIYTTRGCPFSCAFCTEGNPYYNKVGQRTDIEAELEYIGSRIKDQKDLYLSDANFGMYQQDVSKARLIKALQEKYRYPARVVVSTGKNQKERVLSIAAMLDGSLNLAASVQSTDKAILQNVKRENISVATLKEVGARAVDKSTGTYTEVILALPGDNTVSHINTLKDTVDAGFDIIRMYQLILLPQTELNTPECRRKFGMTSMYRIMPRSFGRYDILGQTQLVVESEQICIANDTLPVEDYLDCRELDLMVEIIHNGKVFDEVHGLVIGMGLSWFDFIRFAYDHRHNGPAGVRQIFENFRRESTQDLRPTRAALEAFFAEHAERFLSDDINTNEMASAKAAATFRHAEEIHAFVYDCLRNFLAQQGRLTPPLTTYIDELDSYSLKRKEDFYGEATDRSMLVHFDFLAIGANAYAVDLSRDALPQARNMRYFHSDEQKATLNLLRKEYGQSFNGLSKLVMRQPYLNRLFRTAAWA